MNIENNISKYRSNKHFYFNCKYHVVFCPKYRRNILSDEIGERLKIVFNEIVHDFNSSIEDIEVVGNHVHLILDCDPSFGVTKLIREIKGRSSTILRKEFPILKAKIPSLWTRSSFIATVGSVSLDIVKKYIENQKGK